MNKESELVVDQGLCESEGGAWRVLSLLGDQLRLCLRADEPQVLVFSRRGPPSRRLVADAPGVPGKGSSFQRDQRGMGGGVLLAPRTVDLLASELKRLGERGREEAARLHALVSAEPAARLAASVNETLCNRYLDEGAIKLYCQNVKKKRIQRLPIGDYTRIVKTAEELTAVSDMAPALIPLATYLGGFVAMRQRMQNMGLTKGGWKFLSKQPDSMIRLLMENFQDAQMVVVLNRLALMFGRADMRDVDEKVLPEFFSRSDWLTLSDQDWENFGALGCRLILQRLGELHQMGEEGVNETEALLNERMALLEDWVRYTEPVFDKAQQKGMTLAGLLRRCDEFFELLRRAEAEQLRVMSESGDLDDKKEVRWTAPFPEGFTLDGFRFEPLNSYKGFENESKEVDHCVGRGSNGAHYRMECVKGRSRIYRVHGPQGQRGTLQIGRSGGRAGHGEWALHQFQGRRNRCMSNNANVAARKFILEHFTPAMNAMVKNGEVVVEYCFDDRWITMEDIALEKVSELSPKELVERLKERERRGVAFEAQGEEQQAVAAMAP